MLSNLKENELHRTNKRSFSFVERIWRVTRCTVFSHHYNRLLYSFSRVGVSQTLKKPPCCRTICFGCFHSLDITNKKVRIKKRKCRRRSLASQGIDQLFVCTICGAKELSRGFVPQEFNLPTEMPVISNGSLTHENKIQAKSVKKKKKKSKMNILKSEVVQVASKPESKPSINAFTTFMSSLT
ncbi:unnamed protein product [Heterobilharzia americana]|nr:unnamed protein product [Heterobilharzia americana]